MTASKLFARFTVVLLALSMIAGCAAPAAPTAAPAAPAAPAQPAAPVATTAPAAPAAPAAGAKIVGISMPTKTSTRWISDGNSMVASFEALGYKTDLQFADNDIQNQLSQLENMITKGANVLIIAAIDGSTMSDVLQKAHDAGILVMSYDRLITKTPNVDYYATFDNFGVGVIQGTQLVTGLGLKDGKKGPFNVELFGGSPDDTNAGYFYNGAMSVIQPYIDSGDIVIQSGQMGMDKVGTLRWLAATAQARMDNLLSAFYTDKKVDGVLSPYDGLSIGILSSLKGVGYCTAAQPCPVVTGQDAEVASVKSIIAGEQRYTVFKDTRSLAAQTAKMVDQALKGQTVEINDTKTYDNGVKVVPSYLLTPISIDINNYQKELVDSGYIAASDLPAAPAAPVASGKIVGISMPTKTSTRWISDGNSMVKSFEALGYKTDLQFADNDIQNQLSQLENMITKGANVLIIAAIDGSTMSDVLQKAHDAGILVMSYDRLITKTPNVDYYATFDNFGVGVIQGTQLVTGLGLKDGKKGPFNVELFGGSPDDTNAGYFYNGAMSVIQPYIDSGDIVIQSGQMGMDKVGTLRWLAATAQARMDNLLSAFYTDKKVDGVLSPYDGLSIGILSSLKGVGYCTATQPCPVVTGQDAEVASVKSIIAGEQRYTVFKDTRSLAAQTAKMVDQALKGQTVEINDTKTYDNGVKVVPSYLLIPISIDITNYQKELVDSGYIKAEDLK